MMSRKWVKGGRIDDPLVAINLILLGEPMFEGDKVQNAGWSQNWTISQVKRAVGMGRIHMALPAFLFKDKEAA